MMPFKIEIKQPTNLTQNCSNASLERCVFNVYKKRQVCLITFSFIYQVRATARKPNML